MIDDHAHPFPLTTTAFDPAGVTLVAKHVEREPVPVGDAVPVAADQQDQGIAVGTGAGTAVRSDRRGRPRAARGDEDPPPAMGSQRLTRASPWAAAFLVSGAGVVSGPSGACRRPCAPPWPRPCPRPYPQGCPAPPLSAATSPARQRQEQGEALPPCVGPTRPCGRRRSTSTPPQSETRGSLMRCRGWPRATPAPCPAVRPRAGTNGHVRSLGARGGHERAIWVLDDLRPGAQ